MFDDLTKEESTATKKLQELLISPPILLLPRAKGRYIVDTNDCGKQVGAVLFQKQPYELPKPIVYRSRSLT